MQQNFLAHPYFLRRHRGTENDGFGRENMVTEYGPHGEQYQAGSCVVFHWATSCSSSGAWRIAR